YKIIKRLLKYLLFSSLGCFPVWWVTESGVITVQSALYGRADRETCSEGKPAQQLSNINCYQLGTLDVFKRRCDGKRQCEVNTTTVRKSDPCFGIFKYLDTTYACHPAHSVACEDSYANLHCGQVIFVSSANYGRRDRTTCSTGQPASQVETVTLYLFLTHSCDGKSSCSVKVRGSLFGDPCFGTYKYLEVTYTCQSKFSKAPSDCW
uniref:SUEL-type lectin domain-containing protein n=1 Tax=Anabas testudineus TaxID=64144 RepID=A0A7N5ZPB2_ANATE